MISKKYTSKPFTLTPSIRQVDFRKANLVFHHVEISASTYQARIFFNNQSAGESTPLTLEEGYAGKFTIFGVGRCWGDEGHCMVPDEAREFDQRSPHQLSPREASVDVTEALLRVAIKTARLFVTVVPVIVATRSQSDAADCFHFNKLSMRIRSSHGLLENPNLTEASFNSPIR
jgi:hypothetical protein